MGIKTCKKGKTPIFIVNKRLREAKVQFLIGHDKKEFKYCIITLYIEETPDTNISGTFNEMKQVLAFIYQAKQKRTLISHPFTGVLNRIPFPKVIN